MKGRHIDIMGIVNLTDDSFYAASRCVDVPEVVKTVRNMLDEGATIILSTHNMESVEELCDNIALINKSKVVISGGVEEIRRKYGNNNVEVVYTAPHALVSVPDKFNVLSDVDDSGRHTAVLSLEDGADTNSAISEIMSAGLKISSFRELVPRMNDIFIKLVTEGE